MKPALGATRTCGQDATKKAASSTAKQRRRASTAHAVPGGAARLPGDPEKTTQERPQGGAERGAGIWFSASNALVVTDRAARHRRPCSEAHIPFDLPGAEINSDLSATVLRGSGGTATSGSTIEAMLKALAKACDARRRERGDAGG